MIKQLSTFVRGDKVYAHYQVDVQLLERQSTPDGYVVGVKQPPTVEEVEIEVDLAVIARLMGRKACQNKTGLSRDGAVEVKHVRRKSK